MKLMPSVCFRNICSLNANIENLGALISNLEFSLSVIAVSETSTRIRKSVVKDCVPYIFTRLFIKWKREHL